VELRELRAFITTAEEGSVSAAARRLHVSQSALSQTIRSLERQLGLQLLRRSHTGARTTEAGAILLREGRSLIEHHDRVLAEVTGATATNPRSLRLGVPLEFPPDLLPGVLAHLAATHPKTRIQVKHAASAAQLVMLKAAELDVALVRERPADPRFDAVLAVEEAMGVLLAHSHAAQVAGPDGVHLHDLAGLDWIGFSRSDTPAWYDQVSATLRSHGISVNNPSDHDQRPVTTEVKLAAVGTGQAFALASPDWPQPLPDGISWHPLIGDPIVRRTWAVWPATSRRRDIAALVAALEIAHRSVRANGS
jgi:DNA-binding transcriptional LysR family regulator